MCSVVTTPSEEPECGLLASPATFQDVSEERAEPLRPQLLQLRAEESLSALWVPSPSLFLKIVFGCVDLFKVFY